MSIKEIMKIAKDDYIMYMLNVINESYKNDFSKTEREIKNAEKERKEMARLIKSQLENNNISVVEV